MYQKKKKIFEHEVDRGLEVGFHIMINDRNT